VLFGAAVLAPRAVNRLLSSVLFSGKTLTRDQLIVLPFLYEQRTGTGMAKKGKDGGRKRRNPVRRRTFEEKQMTVLRRIEMGVRLRQLRQGAA
jgi:hypothetical protein